MGEVVQSSQESGTPDFQSILQLTETRDIVLKIFFDFHGLMVDKKGDFKRIAPPMMTFDAVMELIYTTVYPCANMITSRTTFTEYQIKVYHKNIMIQTGNWFASFASHRMISPKMWEIIVQMEKDVDKEKPYIKVNEQVIKNNEIYKKYGISWSYNKELYEDLVLAVKRDYLLEREQFAKDMRIMKSLSSVFFLIHGAMNRSLNATYLNHEKVTHKETNTFSSAEDKSQGGGWFENQRQQQINGGM
jgi:hypothetical protein